ncbi:MAG: alpha-glucan family phosphorylase, partial [Candidatus Paceibacterota bacterium]
LAADLLFEAADQGLPLVALGMRYEDTYPDKNGFEPVRDKSGGPIEIAVPIGDEMLPARAWVKRLGPTVSLYLLDPKSPLNPKEDSMAGTLYDQHFYTRLKQQMLIGIGGFRLLRTLSIEPKVYHIHEGNMAFAALAFLAEGFSAQDTDIATRVQATRAKFVATKHTILEAGLEAPADDLWRFIGPYCKEHGITKELIMSLGAHGNDPDIFAATKFIIGLSGKANGVSIIHTVFEKEKHPESQLMPITNGVYLKRWQAPGFVGAAKSSSDAALWQTKAELREKLVREAASLSGVTLDPAACTMVWTRRFVPYKRPLALFDDPARLAAILRDPDKPAQVIISGAIYAGDPNSVALLEKVKALAADPAFAGKIAFLPGYSIELAKLLVAGADIWLNTPKRGKEACGTSSMKAGLNGALQMSVADGWIDEVDWKGIGWTLPDEALPPALYDALEKEALPLFYARRGGVPVEWVKRMRETIAIVESRYTTKRTLRDYREKLYGM